MIALLIDKWLRLRRQTTLTMQKYNHEHFRIVFPVE